MVSVVLADMLGDPDGVWVGGGVMVELPVADWLIDRLGVWLAVPDADSDGVCVGGGVMVSL
jgi:hypothetical protein